MTFACCTRALPAQPAPSRPAARRARKLNGPPTSRIAPHQAMIDDRQAQRANDASNRIWFVLEVRRRVARVRARDVADEISKAPVEIGLDERGLRARECSSQPSVVGCRLSAAGSRLSAINFQLSAFSFQL